MTEFTTSVSEVGDGVVNLRGYSLGDVMRCLTFTEGAYLSIVGRLPSDSERRMLDTVLNSLLDHGFVASTVTAARYIASGNPQLIPAVAGGLLAAGSNTLSPQDSYHLLERAETVRTGMAVTPRAVACQLVEEYVEAGRRIPGFGHPTHKHADFRADILFERAAELGVAGSSVEQLCALHSEFVARTGRKTIPINIDGALAAIGRDMGWTVHQTVAFAALSVLPGLMAHVIEEIDTRKPLRYITDGAYVGEPMQSLPPPGGDR